VILTIHITSRSPSVSPFYLDTPSMSAEEIYGLRITPCTRRKSTAGTGVEVAPTSQTGETRLHVINDGRPGQTRRPDPALILPKTR